MRVFLAPSIFLASAAASQHRIQRTRDRLIKFVDDEDDSYGQWVEEKFHQENFRVNREMRDEILVYDLFLTKF